MLGKLKPPFPPVPPISSAVPPKEAPASWGGDAMDTLKMKIGLLADIHGNSDALASVLSDAKDCGITRLLVAGDLVGYYYSAKKVLNLLLQQSKLNFVFF